MAHKPLKRRKASILSPLRYPGAKRRLAGYIAESISLNNLRPKILVEPFAGGASVALQLLNDSIVESIVLGEKDPLIASLWKIIFKDPEWLIKQVERTAVNVGKWRYYKNTRFRTDRERAIACLFLNRTSFSGIIAPRAGPLGGYRQESDYRIDCRFPVSTIVKRIRQAAGLADRVLFVNQGDWRKTIEKVEKLGLQEGIFYYLDPPFYKNAERLYGYYFEQRDHKALHDFLLKTERPWILSYDPAEEIKTLYSDNGCEPAQVELLYCVAGKKEIPRTEELIISNLSELPEETRLWRTGIEWRELKGKQKTGK